ncbi:MAG: arginase family protein, partial [Anaerolineae bacterium]|nr:arginase family protein [Anaerolineae bacterium]
MTNLVCMGVPYFIGERIERRTEVSAIRDSGIAREIGADWVKVTPHRNESNPLSAVNCALADAVAAHRDALPIIFASDCVSALGTVKGLDREVAVLWYDAHGDFNTLETTPSGFLGGMPL